MWDYDKLFAKNNVIGLKALHNDKIFVHGVSDEYHWGETNRVDWHDFRNKELKVSGFEIQYIIRLDKHGNVIEKLFDRDTDIPKSMPKLETGMFARVYDEGFGYIDTTNNRIVYQNGTYDDINGEFGIISDIIEVYGKESCSFNGCVVDKPIWRSPEYQDYFDFKN